MSTSVQISSTFGHPFSEQSASASGAGHVTPSSGGGACGGGSCDAYGGGKFGADGLNSGLIDKASHSCLDLTGLIGSQCSHLVNAFVV